MAPAAIHVSYMHSMSKSSNSSSRRSLRKVSPRIFTLPIFRPLCSHRFRGGVLGLPLRRDPLVREGGVLRGAIYMPRQKRGWVENAGGEWGAAVVGRVKEMSCLLSVVSCILPDAYSLLLIPCSHWFPCISPGIPEIPAVVGCSTELTRALESRHSLVSWISPSPSPYAPSYPFTISIGVCLNAPRGIGAACTCIVGPLLVVRGRVAGSFEPVTG